MDSSYLQRKGEPLHEQIGVQVSTGAREEMQDLNVVGTLAEFEPHVEGLTQIIPKTKVNPIPMRLQRYTIGCQIGLVSCYAKYPT